MEEHQRDWLAAEEIVAFMQAAYDPAYALVEAEYDLGRLAAWNNLIAEQDRARAAPWRSSSAAVSSITLRNGRWLSTG